MPGPSRVWSDYPLLVNGAQRAVINSLQELGITGTTPVPSSTWPVANLAIYIPVYVRETLTATKIRVAGDTTAANNIDAGIYNYSGTRLVSVGSTALGGGNVVMDLNIADTVLVKGIYYIGIAVDGTTGRVGAIPVGSTYDNMLYGIREETSAFPLPATATFADNNIRKYIPNVSIIFTL